MEVLIKKLDRDAKIPKRSTDGAAGYDIYAAIENPVDILPGETRMINTGIAMQLPAGYFAGIYARSGIAATRGLRPSDCVGVIDEDYRGEVFVSLRNDSDELQIVYNGDRVAQMVLQRYETMDFKESDIKETQRGKGGFGSTGK